MEKARPVAEGLGEGDPHLERHDLLPLRIAQRIDLLRMALRRSVRLVGEILVDGHPLQRLPAVPHDGGEEAEVRRRQRPAEERQLLAAGVPVRIVHGRELELRAVGNRQADTDQPLADQEREGAGARFFRGEVGLR